MKTSTRCCISGCRNVRVLSWATGHGPTRLARRDRDLGLDAVVSALQQAARLLDERQQPWALVGGLAVSMRVELRCTCDIDLAVAVTE